MLINALKFMENTQLAYPKRVQNRILINVLLIIVGILATVISLLFDAAIVSDFLSGFYLGTGIGLITAGIILLVINLRLLRNADMMRKRLIAETDERNQHILLRSCSISFFATGAILYIALLFTGLIDLAIFTTVLGVLVLMALVFGITTFIMKKTC